MTADRTAYIDGLRALAAALETDPELPLPYDGSTTQMSVFVETKEEAAAYARLLGKAEKHVTDESSYGFRLHGAIDGLRVIVYAPRDQVCTRRVVGTREVTRTVLDPDALAAVPTVEVTEVVEDVAWDCHPLLAPAIVPSSAEAGS